LTFLRGPVPNFPDFDAFGYAGLPGGITTEQQYYDWARIGGTGGLTPTITQITDAAYPHHDIFRIEGDGYCTIDFGGSTGVAPTYLQLYFNNGSSVVLPTSAVTYGFVIYNPMSPGARSGWTAPNELTYSFELAWPRFSGVRL